VRSNRQLYPTSSIPLLSPIRPTRTVDTPLRLLTDVLPTKLAFHLLLDNIVIRASRIRKRNNPKRQRNAYKAYDLVEKTAVGKHYGAVVERLLDCVIAVGNGAIVVWTVFEDGKLLVQVAREEGEERDDWQDDVGDERVGAGSEGGCETGIC
jgi:hypothetical protein